MPSPTCLRRAAADMRNRRPMRMGRESFQRKGRAKGNKSFFQQFSTSGASRVFNDF